MSKDERSLKKVDQDFRSDGVLNNEAIRQYPTTPTPPTPFPSTPVPTTQVPLTHYPYMQYPYAQFPHHNVVADYDESTTSIQEDTRLFPFFGFPLFGFGFGFPFFRPFSPFFSPFFFHRPFFW